MTTQESIAARQGMLGYQPRGAMSYRCQAWIDAYLEKALVEVTRELAGVGDDVPVKEIGTYRSSALRVLLAAGVEYRQMLKEKAADEADAARRAAQRVSESN